MPADLVTEEHPALPPPEGIPVKGLTSGSTFLLRRENIFKRLQQSAQKCREKYVGRKELATETDDVVVELCEALEDAFSYGLRQQHGTVVLTAASIFQNMHEIVTRSSSSNTVNDVFFWDFCRTHLTAHERKRFEELKNVCTKCGFGRAFLRATLNENSLQRYVLTWLDDQEGLRRFFTPWSLLLDAEVSSYLPKILSNLDKILFALTVDSTALNAPMRTTSHLVHKEEPIIHAPIPAPAANTKSKRKTNAIERPITSTTSTEDLLKQMKISLDAPISNTEVEAAEELLAQIADLYAASSPDPIEPELEFLKQPLPDYNLEPSPSSTSNSNGAASNTPIGEQEYDDIEDKSDTSSQYSKSSSAANCAASANQLALEEKLREMSERCDLLETRVAKLTLENRQLVRRLRQQFNESGIDPSSSLTANFLITIPLVKLLKSKGNSGSAYYAYEIHITMRKNLEHWSLMRRYRDFYKLHKSLLRTHPSIAAVDFPPKKHFGNMNLVFVEERRQQLQIYLCSVVESLPQVEACKTKAELQKVFPFLRER